MGGVSGCDTAGECNLLSVVAATPARFAETQAIQRRSRPVPGFLSVRRGLRAYPVGKEPVKRANLSGRPTLGTTVRVRSKRMLTLQGRVRLSLWGQGERQDTGAVALRSRL